MTKSTDRLVCIQCGASVHPFDKLKDRMCEECHYPLDLDNPPRGVKYKCNDQGFIISVPTRRIGIGIFFVLFIPFAVLIPIGLIASVTEQTAGFFSWLIGGSLGLWFLWLALKSFFGGVRISANGYDGEFFEGIGRIGRRRNFSWKDVKSIQTNDIASRDRIDDSSTRIERLYRTVQINSPEKIEFGADISVPRRVFIKLALQSLLSKMA